MSTEKKKEQQLLEDVTAQPAAQSSYSTAGLNSRKEVENAQMRCTPPVRASPTQQRT